MTRDYNKFAGGIFKHLTFRQIIKFSIVGIGNTIIDFIIYLVLTRTLGVYFLIANLISVAVAKFFSFTFNRRWTFRSRNKDAIVEFGKFVIVGVVYYILNNLLLYLFVGVGGINDLISKIIVIVVGMLWNFTAHKYWTFKKTMYSFLP